MQRQASSSPASLQFLSTEQHKTARKTRNKNKLYTMYALVYNITTKIKCHKGKTEHNCCIWLHVAYNVQMLLRYGFTDLMVLCLRSQYNRKSMKCLVHTFQAWPAEVESAMIDQRTRKITAEEAPPTTTSSYTHRQHSGCLQISQNEISWVFQVFQTPWTVFFHTIIMLKPDVTNHLTSHFGTFLALMQNYRIYF